MDDLAIAAYQCVLQTGRRDNEALIRAHDVSAAAAATAFSTLETLHLIERVNDTTWVAANPDLAIGSLVTPMEVQSRRLAEMAEQLRTQVRTLVPLHAAHRDPTENEFATVLDGRAVNRLIEVEADRCAEEVLALQPGGGRPVERLAQAQKRDLGLLRRGAQLRTVYQHGSRYHLPTSGYVETLTRAGADFRTVDEIPDRMLLFDRRVCFLPMRWRTDPDDVPNGDAQPETGSGAIVIRQPSLISFLVKMFHVTWDRAEPFQPHSPQPDKISDQVKNAILQLMATGAKDEVIARRLGFSVRTCRRHISEVMQSLGADSRFQAGVQAQSQMMVHPRPRADHARVSDSE
ncbi:helix-turn-helix transcriptional regulator [Actinoplanes sp. LDG1-06]|uniref:Helix-turn-helix transcriptional regulator n=1 Tax=Paractinoplanes ovalisporus TaxID=2810368 RepID=A0ABS2AKK8_9ACTN|nr:helix-turn-helix transcriptional regulator [Actinoplanes ovalisporus]MBM2620383.1 helix-turn-helix transcriptional regulator [Actinoplanes ovalisporus]